VSLAPLYAANAAHRWDRNCGCIPSPPTRMPAFFGPDRCGCLLLAGFFHGCQAAAGASQSANGGGRPHLRHTLSKEGPRALRRGAARAVSPLRKPRFLVGAHVPGHSSKGGPSGLSHVLFVRSQPPPVARARTWAISSALVVPPLSTSPPSPPCSRWPMATTATTGSSAPR